MAGAGGELLIVEHVKYRTSDAGKSPIGTIHVFREYVEWRDANSPSRHKISYGDIKGQRVSPPGKSKVQLQIITQDEGQSTFVFLRPNTDVKALAAERDATKETIQQALVAHRQNVLQMTRSAESGSRDAELAAKQNILKKDKQLSDLYKHLVQTKLLTSQDFWMDYYKTTGKMEDRAGITGAFMANLSTSDTNGIKLNLNTNIIQNIFATYPMVELKHLELVPHEMSEHDFWVKFAQSHYFHREREVLPNPDDPFADCLKADEEEISKIVSGGAKRKRLNFDYLSDNVVSEINGAQRGDTTAAAATGKDRQRATLIRRCNYLSERILQTQQASGAATAAAAASSSSTTSANGAPVANGTSNGVNGTASKSNGGGGGYAVLHRWMGDGAEDAMESAELADDEPEQQLQPIKVEDGKSVVVASFAPEDAARFRSIVTDFIDSVDEQDILDPQDWLLEESPSTSNNGASNGYHAAEPARPLDPATQWGPLTPYVSEIRVVHSGVAELVKHFWMCFPPITPELEAKIERMGEALRKYEASTLPEAEQRFGAEAFLHARDMIRRALTKYAEYKARQRR